MTPPRECHANQTVFVTSRAVGRTFRFVPNERVTQLVLYLVAYAAGVCGVEVHDFCWMSNHWHMTLTVGSTHGLPQFVNRLNSPLARCLNAMRGWSGTVFEKGYHVVRVNSAEEYIRTAAYTLANPCKADLVTRARHWKGASSAKMAYGETVTLERPRIGLWKRSAESGRSRKRAMARGRAEHLGRTVTPLKVQLTLTRPPFFEGMTNDEIRAKVLAELEKREDEFEAERREAGRRVLGMRKARKQHWQDTPRTREELLGETGTRGRSQWALDEATQRRRAFVEAYREAWKLWVGGEREVLFPAGTWLMRQRFNVRCGASPP